MILSRTARSAAAFGGLRSLTRSSTRTECCPSDQGRSLGLSKTWIGGRRWDKLCPRSLSPAPRRAANNTFGCMMQLSPGQLKEFDEQGYLFFPNCFREEEIAQLRDDAEAILKLDRQEVWREKTGAPRTAFAAHTFTETFRLLACHPRLVEPLRQLFGEDVYVHQFKLNAKAAFEGEVWQWHQDYGTCARDEHRGVPGRGDADQWRVDADPEEPPARRAGGRT